MVFNPASGILLGVVIYIYEVHTISLKHHCFVHFSFQVCFHFPKANVVLLLSQIFKSMFKCVNEAAFLCCWPVDKLSYRLTAFTVVLP